MARISAASIVLFSTNSHDRTIWWKTYWPSWVVIGSFSIYITAYLSPSSIVIFINSYMTRISTTSVVYISTNRYNRTISWQADGRTWVVTRAFSIYITAYLSPGSIVVFINTYMTSIVGRIIVSWGTNSYNRTISWETYWPSRVVTRAFSIYITTYLCPGAIIIFINTYMASIGGSSIVINTTNRQNRAIIWKTYWPSKVVIRAFSIYITTYLCPGAIVIFINTHMTTISTISIICEGAYRYNRTIWWQTNWMSRAVIVCFSIYITTYLCPCINYSCIRITKSIIKGSGINIDIILSRGLKIICRINCDLSCTWSCYLITGNINAFDLWIIRGFVNNDIAAFNINNLIKGEDNVASFCYCSCVI